MILIEKILHHLYWGNKAEEIKLNNKKKEKTSTRKAADPRGVFF